MSEPQFQIGSWTDSPLTSPTVHSIDLNIQVDLFSSGLNVALKRHPQFSVSSDMLGKQAAVRVLPIKLPKSKHPKVHSYYFDDSADENSQTFLRPAVRPKQKGHAAASKQQHTRVKPPQDIVKLEDRLFYLLQPPLELMLDSREIHFPFEPFPYQLHGIAFLYPRFSAVLADEMGLGKTMQAITSMRLLFRTGEIRSALLVCPKPLVTNWQREIALWAPELPVNVVEGNQARRTFRWQQARGRLTIANYESVVRDRDVVCDKSNSHFDLVVIDEAQRIKNRSSNTSRVVRSIPRSRNWALTGTPVENSPEDLVGIFEFLSPGYLSPTMRPRRMGQAVADHVLRRTKDKVLTDLPPKMFRDADLELSEEQWVSYETAESEGVVRLNEMGKELTIQHVFELVLRLKQICNFDPATLASSKLERLEADLEEISASGQKAIVFSQWVESIKRLSSRLQRFGPLEYHGKVPHRKRDDVLKRFRENEEHTVLLMSYGAGSVGLNLQFCQYVFLFDRWWNPAVEDQAINRAHRIGAAGPVTVSRFTTRGTIEERIQQVLEEKREMFATIFAETSTPKLGLTQDEIFGLFNLKQASDKAA